MLIDFSDILQTNLYVLGSLYLKLVRLLDLDIPIIDPSLFIPRFCAKLDFKDKASVISQTALRILQSMRRNWIHIGRRPSGLCGAAILIAARCHNLHRSIQDIVEVVHVCEETVRKRIDEFATTDSSKLTQEEFEQKYDCKAMAEGDEDGLDPPSYIKNRLKENKMLFEQDIISEVERKALEIENQLIKRLRHKNLTANNQVKVSFHSVSGNKPDVRSVMGLNQYTMSKDDDESISEISDNEAESYFLSKEEYKLKKNLWEIMYRDWIQEQDLKKYDQEKKELLNKKRSRRLSLAKCKGGASPIVVAASDPVEAIKYSNKFPRKMNYEKMGEMFRYK